MQVNFLLSEEMALNMKKKYEWAFELVHARHVRRFCECNNLFEIPTFPRYILNRNFFFLLLIKLVTSV